MTPLLRLGTALALIVCAAPGFADPRLVSHRYNENEVVRIEGRANVQASIQFDEDEHIENVAVGDSNAWQITPNKRANMLFVKPLARAARTNMTVITDQRTYYFDLIAAPQARPLYVLRFTYPEAAKPAAPANQSASLTAEEKALAEAPAPVAEKPVDPASLNFAWDKKGKASLFPARLYDDGASVYLSWTPGVPVPAILTRDEKGTEGPVNYAVRGDTIVVEGAPRVLLLRSGRNSAVLSNAAPARAAVPAPAEGESPQTLAVKGS